MIGPAYLQPNGRRMYPAATGHGWTWNPALAAENYTEPDPEEDPMTVLTDEGDVATMPRRTATMGYPLPPPAPRAEAAYDGWGRYKLPSPTTGRPTGFTRATTIADTLDDTYNLSRWKRRETAKRIVALMDDIDVAEIAGVDVPENDFVVALRQAVAADDKSKIDYALDQLDNAMGGKEAAELGTAVHAWIEAVEIGTVARVNVPEQFTPYVDAYFEVLARHGLVGVPEYVERIVLNDRGEETIVGTLDRIYLCVATGELILGDVKTSKTLEYSWMSYAVQLAIYGYATKMLSTDGKRWEPMPAMKGLTDAEMEEGVRPYGVIIHVPSDQPERSSAVTMDLWFGAETMVVALETRRRRKEAKSAVPFVHALPPATKESLRYVAARQALLSISSPDELEKVWETYQDIWDDDLTEVGNTVAQLL